MAKEHTYTLELRWTGNRGEGTRTYTGYGREHEIRGGGKPVLVGSADPAFRGDPDRWNPEELLLAALAACHQLAYLHLCAAGGIVVESYTDRAAGTMAMDADGGGHFVEAVLRPEVTLAPGADEALARRLHEDAARLCFIARSVNFPVRHEVSLLSHAG